MYEADYDSKPDEVRAEKEKALGEQKVTSSREVLGEIRVDGKTGGWMRMRQGTGEAHTRSMDCGFEFMSRVLRRHIRI